MAKLRKSQQWALLKSPKRSFTHNKVVKVSKKKKAYRRNVAFTKAYEEVFCRNGRSEIVKHKDDTVKAVVFEFDRIEQK